LPQRKLEGAKFRGWRHANFPEGAKFLHEILEGAKFPGGGCLALAV
jgi:hypothetical protein